jgi:NADH-quinone oxidoreductase subunit J
MQTIMFGLLALTAVVGGIMVITRKNPVYSILWLVLTFFSFAGLYVLLGANFLAAVQIIVYAGAIMVLFLFVVMMLNLREPEKLEQRKPLLVGLGVVVGGGLGLVLLTYIVRARTELLPAAEQGVAAYAQGGPTWLGKELFTNYVFAVEVAGVLLLAAVIGAVALAKKTRV